MRRRDISQWVLRIESRTTLNEQLGGALYDFIDSHAVVLFDGRRKSLLSCVRESTRMGDKTLQKVFRGETNKSDQYQRVECAIQEWLSTAERIRLFGILTDVRMSYYRDRGDEFLDEQRQKYRPKRKASPP